MSQESSASELEMAKEYSKVLAGTDDEDDRYLNATVCRSGGTTHPDLQTNTIHPL